MSLVRTVLGIMGCVTDHIITCYRLNFSFVLLFVYFFNLEFKVFKIIIFIIFKIKMVINSVHMLVIYCMNFKNVVLIEKILKCSILLPVLIAMINHVQLHLLVVVFLCFYLICTTSLSFVLSLLSV